MKKSKKALIVEAAVKCFSENGVADTSMKEIAKRAKVDPPLILYYFPNNEALYKDVIGFVLESLKEASLEPLRMKNPTPDSVLEAYIRAPFDWARKNPGLGSIWMYFYYLSTFKTDFQIFNHEIRKTGRERISIMIYQGIEKGIFKPSGRFSVEELSYIVQGLMTGNTILYSTEGKRERFIVDQTVDTAFDLLGFKKAKKNARRGETSPG